MSAVIRSFLLALSIAPAPVALADVKPGAIDLTKGPTVLATYTNFYNDSDLSATCVVYVDATAMLLADGIVPYKKPKFIKVPKPRLAELKALIAKTTKAMTEPKEFSGYNAIPYGWLDHSDTDMGVLYFGAVGSGTRPERDLVQLSSDSNVAKLVRKICGYGDDL